MSLNKNEPEMGKNFWLAMALSMLVIFGYPAFINWLHPPGPVTEMAENQNTQEMSGATGDAAENPVSDNTGPAQEAPISGESFIGSTPPPVTFPFENDLYHLEFSTRGAAITRLKYKGSPSEDVTTQAVLYKEQAAQSGLFGIRVLHDKEDLTQSIFKASDENGASQSRRFSFERAGEYRIEKEYIVGAKEPVILLNVFIENISARERHFPLEFHAGLSVDMKDQMSAQQNEAVIWTDKVESANQGKLSKKGFDVAKDIAWAGAIKKYFTVLVKPNWRAVAFEARAQDDEILTELRMEPLTLLPGESVTKQFLIYAGPQHYETLQNLGLGFETILSKGFFGLFKVWLLIALKFLNRLTHNYGLAIILLTLLIKGVFAPLTHMSYKSMKKMQAIQPKIKALQEQYKKDPEKLNRETMELFKRNRVNPMAGCLPMLVQMPILFAMFRLLPEAIELKGAPFIWWIRDLSAPDQLMIFPFTVPLLGWTALNLLPILMTASQFWYQKIMPQTTTAPEQAKVMAFMPIFFGFVCYNMPSGLVLYWFIQNLLSIIQQVFVNRIVVALHHEDRE